jgi:tetratricopeptide (TPR) repeat protein
MKRLIYLLLAIPLLVACSSEVVKEIPQVKNEKHRVNPKQLATEFFIDGSIAETKGLLNEAVEKYLEAYKNDSRPGIANSIAKNYFRLNKLGPALEYSKLATTGEPKNVDYLLLLASIYTNSHFEDSSAVVFKKVIELDSTNATAYFNLAQLYESKRPSEALVLFKKVIDLIGPEWNVLVHLVDINERLGNIDETIKTVEELISLNSSDLNLQKVLVEAYMKSNKLDKALNTLDAAMISFPDDLNLIELRGALYVHKGELKKAANEYIKLVKSKELPFEEKIKVGLSFLTEAEKDSANLPLAKNIFEVIDKDSSDWQVKAYLGEIAIRQQKDSVAIRYLEKSTELAEWNAQVWSRLGGLLFDSRKYKEAIRFMDKAVQKFPNDFPINLIYGLSLSQDNSHEKAKEYFQRALKINPDDVTALGALGFTLNQLKEEDEAIKVLNKALSIDPKNIQALSLSALINETKRNFQVSDSLYQVALKSDSSNSLILNNLAYSYADRGIKLNEALLMAKQAIAKDPTNSSFLDTIGWIYYKLGEYKKAKENIEAAVKLEVGNPTLLEHLGDVYSKLKDKKKAIEYWKKAFSLDETKTEIKIKIEKGEV